MISIEPKTFIYQEFELKSPEEIGKLSGEAEDNISNFLEKKNIKQNGPIENHYLNMGKDNQPHILRVCIPIQSGTIKLDLPKNLKLFESGKFQGLSSDFNGPMFKIGEAWGNLIQKAKKENLTHNNYDREIYHLMDHENNKIKIQLILGIKQ